MNVPAKTSTLNPRQQKFVEEYLRDYNGTQAAIRAGYSPKTARVQASDLLMVPDIAAAVEARKQQIVEKTDTTVQELLTEWKKLAMLNIASIVVRDEHGAPVCKGGFFEIDWSKATDDIFSAISQIDGKSKRVKFYDKLKVHEYLARYHGLFKDDAPAVNINLTLEQLIVQSMAPAEKAADDAD